MTPRPVMPASVALPIRALAVLIVASCIAAAMLTCGCKAIKWPPVRMPYGSSGNVPAVAPEVKL
jgi:hypothetical protein